MRPGQADKIGAAGKQNGIYLVGLGDVAHRHGGKLRFIADAVAERRLEHAAIDRLRID